MTGCPTSSDRAVIRARLGREPFTDYMVSVRCRHGRPAVLRNTPRDLRGRPFPTREWLLDEGLRVAVSRLEAAGGVRMLEAEDALKAPLAAAHARHAALQSGYRIAGAGDPRYVKCLHAQLAFALAEGGNPIGDWIMFHAGIDWPADCCPDFPVDDDEARDV